MAEENTNPEQAASSEKEQTPVFNIKRIFLKDLSFETPMGVEGFSQKNPPQVGQELNIQTNKLDESHYEVVLLLTITAKIEDRVAFLIEVKQAGVFEISGLNSMRFGQTINTLCPNVLFPYARETIDSVLSRGTFAALMLPPINFDAMFVQAIQQQQQAEAEAKTKAEAGTEAKVETKDTPQDS